MNATQTKWLKDNGIKVRETSTMKFFVKGDKVLYYYGSKGKWEMEREDRSEDGDGSIHLGSFPTLKEGLAELRK